MIKKQFRQGQTRLFASNLYFFFILYLAVAMAILKVQKSKLSGVLPTALNHQQLTIGLILGGVIVVVLNKVVKKRAKYLSALFILMILLGAISINVFNIYYQFSSQVVAEPGDIIALGERRWPYEPGLVIYEAIYQHYLSHEVVVNPGILDIVDTFYIYNMKNFGVETKWTENVPEEISREQFSRIENMDKLEYHVYWHDNIEYRLYEVLGEDDQILLTNFNNKILYVPITLIGE